MYGNLTQQTFGSFQTCSISHEIGNDDCLITVRERTIYFCSYLCNFINRPAEKLCECFYVCSKYILSAKDNHGIKCGILNFIVRDDIHV